MTNDEYEFIYCETCRSKNLWPDSVFLREGVCGECGKKGKHFYSKIRPTKDGGIFKEKICTLIKDKSHITMLREKHNLWQYDPEGKYCHYVWIDDSGKNYFLGAFNILAEDGLIFKYPEDTIEFTYYCPDNDCLAYRDGGCQTINVDFIDVITLNKKGEQIVGSACRSKAIVNRFCGSTPVWSYKEWEEIHKK